MFKIFPQVASRGGIHLSISNQQSEEQVGVGVRDGGWGEGLILIHLAGNREYARLLYSYQSVNSHNYDENENLTVCSLLDFCCELHFLTAPL